ncbi:HYR domain-containing protein, partial [Salinimicrobium soli]|uniref:HYR domain-containing protein n=1 Tax=Salinimicrobium soli TaxID=1254399 RepID=UPI003AAF0A55
MGKKTTSVFLIGFLLVLNSALASYWKNFSPTTYSFPALDQKKSTAWEESPFGIFSFSLLDEEWGATVIAANDISKNTDEGYCLSSIDIPDASYTGTNLNWVMTGATSGSGSGQVGSQDFNKGVTTITYTASDGSSTAEDVMQITVTDNENPKITLGSDISRDTDSGQCTASIAIPNATFSDNCSGETLSWTMSGATTDSGSNQVGTKTFNKGQTTITYKVTDAAGNFITKDLSITVTDTENPEITLGSDISRDTDSGQCTASIAIPNATFSDNCSGETLSWTMSGATTASGSNQVGTKTFNIGTTTINYTVTDATNNTVTGSIDVVVSDNEDPKITLGSDISRDTDNGQCTAAIAIPNAGFDDNCSGSSLSWTMSGATSGSGSSQVGTKTFNIGTTTINYTVTDAANNTVTGSIDVVVSDNENPKITLG